MRKHFGIILMIDALGVSQYNIKECRDFLIKQKNLEEHFQSLKAVFGSWAPHYKFSQASIFGDTIIHCWPIDSKKITDHYSVIYDVVADASLVLQDGVKNGVLYRGCIAIGDYIFEKNTVLGPAVFDAHDWYESANWFGVILTPKTQLLLESLFEKENRKTKDKSDEELEQQLSRLLVRYEVPLSHCASMQNTKEFWSVAWPFWYFNPLKEEITEESPREVVLKDLFKISQSKDGEPKFKNSIDFFDWYHEKFYPD